MKARKSFKAILVLAMIFAGSAALPAHATVSPSTLTSDLNNLVTQGSTLVATMSKIVLTPATTGSQLSQLETSVASYQASVTTAYNTLAVGTGTFSVTPEMLTALQSLSAINATLGSGVAGLSQSMVTIAPMTFFSTLQSSMTTMLRLSDDIGAMSNRILEMADKILAMADNIGAMADRILATQVIQSANIKMIVDAMLQTQQNAIVLTATFKL
jgi:hypothetical protein